MHNIFIAAVWNDKSFFYSLSSIITTPQSLIMEWIHNFNWAVILIGFKAAIQTVILNSTPQWPFIIECRQMLPTLSRQQKLVIFQWIPSYVKWNSRLPCKKKVKKCHANQPYLEPYIKPLIIWNHKWIKCIWSMLVTC